MTVEEQKVQLEFDVPSNQAFDTYEIVFERVAEMVNPEDPANAAAELYLAAVLHKKNSKVANRKIHVGEFLYDHFGDLIGFYAGDGYITMPEEFK